MSGEELEYVKQQFDILKVKIDSLSSDLRKVTLAIENLSPKTTEKDTISVFDTPETRHIYNALFSLGCDRLSSITEWRKVVFDREEYAPVFQVRVNGRFANLPIGFTEIEMRTIESALIAIGRAFPTNGVVVSKLPIN